jgi:hypothetical protein
MLRLGSSGAKQGTDGNDGGGRDDVGLEAGPTALSLAWSTRTSGLAAIGVRYPSLHPEVLLHVKRQQRPWALQLVPRLPTFAPLR